MKWSRHHPEPAAGERLLPGGQGICGSRVAFSLVEILVVISILSLIVLALMSVFSATQRAFRASVTQTDVLQGGRAALELITADLQNAAPCGGFSFGTNSPFGGTQVNVGINFFVTNNNPNPITYTPLTNSLPGSGFQRTNLLQWFFILGRQNTQWTGVGYIVDTASTTDLYPLYRYSAVTNTSVNPAVLFNNFVTDISEGEAGFTNMSHVIDGVAHLVVHAYDMNGILMTNGYSFGMNSSLPRNTWFTPPGPGGEVGFAMTSNAVPATVELQMAIFEDRAMARATSLAVPGVPLTAGTPQWNYLVGQSGALHIFRERVTIENLDPAAYQ